MESSVDGGAYAYAEQESDGGRWVDFITTDLVIVDDLETNVQLLEQMLKAAGYPPL